VREWSRDTPLIQALKTMCPRGDADEVKRLVSEGADINECSKVSLMTPLMWSILLQLNYDVVIYLLQHGADPELREVCGTNALCYAAGVVDPFYVSLLRAHGADTSMLVKDEHHDMVELYIAPDLPGYYSGVGLTPWDIFEAGSEASSVLRAHIMLFRVDAQLLPIMSSCEATAAAALEGEEDTVSPLGGRGVEVLLRENGEVLRLVLGFLNPFILFEE